MRALFASPVLLLSPPSTRVGVDQNLCFRPGAATLVAVAERSTAVHRSNDSGARRTQQSSGNAKNRPEPLASTTTCGAPKGWSRLRPPQAPGSPAARRRPARRSRRRRPPRRQSRRPAAPARQSRRAGWQTTRNLRRCRPPPGPPWRQTAPRLRGTQPHSKLNPSSLAHWSQLHFICVHRRRTGQHNRTPQRRTRTCGGSLRRRRAQPSKAAAAAATTRAPGRRRRRRRPKPAGALPKRRRHGRRRAQPRALPKPGRRRPAHAKP